MAFPDELLRLAEVLAAADEPDTKQARMRRAVSTAYYAVFHLVIQDAAERWQGSPEARTGFERGFQHGQMKNASHAFRSRTWKDWHRRSHEVPPAVQYVATAFVVLQDERLLADYDNHDPWALNEVREVLDTARQAFQEWPSIRTDPIAGNYLLTMFLPRPC